LPAIAGIGPTRPIPAMKRTSGDEPYDPHSLFLKNALFLAQPAPLNASRFPSLSSSHNNDIVPLEWPQPCSNSLAVNYFSCTVRYVPKRLSELHY
jgi:hypothetical protein